MPDERTAYIVFDIETVPNGSLIADVLYAGENLSAEEAVARQEKEALDASDGKSSFVPLTFQAPVIIAVARVSADFQLQKVAILDAPHYRERRMVELFWKGIETYPDATLVDFGGRGFDLPVLELAAFRHGISLPTYFGKGGAYRARFGDRHLDIMEWLGNWGAYRMRGGLNLLAKMLGKPGKMDVRGELVAGLWREGKKNLVASYCVCDVLDTYFVFLRTRVLTGNISCEDETRIEAHARSVIEDLAFDDPTIEDYLKRCARPPESA
jgi:predicted PolB exonuclease-like 3'-5' exonuclease